MENAHDTLAADCTRVEARFPHRLGQPRTPPIRSTGKIVVLFENDVTGRTRTPVAKPMGGNRPRKRRCAPTSRSRSPDSVFTIPGSGVQLHRNAQAQRISETSGRSPRHKGCAKKPPRRTRRPGAGSGARRLPAISSLRRPPRTTAGSAAVSAAGRDRRWLAGAPTAPRW